MTALVGAGDIVRQLTALGLPPGAILVVHTAFRSVGPIDGGPGALIDALIDVLGSSGTLVMPSWGDLDESEVFDPLTSPCRGLGIVADTFWRRRGVHRSDSPHSFAAVGPRADAILAPHPPDVPHGPDSPVGRAHDLDGWVLLLGAGHDANTTVHLGEYVADVPYRLPKTCTVLRDGRPVRVEYGEIDHCCRNFAMVGDWLAARGLERQGPVGRGVARLMRARDVVSVVVDELRHDRCRFLCRSGCAECAAARASVPVGKRPTAAGGGTSS
jgi:aminoglycoside N3'-acetyltransferase